MDTASSSTINGRHQSASNSPILVLEPINDTFVLKSLDLPDQVKVKIGRQTGVTTAPHPSNGYFDSKVLSRVHAEVWSEAGKVYIRDLKSSNGTFLNGKRLCHENTESEPFELNQNDGLEFGIDIMDENGALLHEKVSCKIYISKMSYPTPGSSPQDSHAKLKPVSPSASGVNSMKTNSTPAHGGQSDNIDLIISRLQSELTRSQETYADLGFLKHGLGELEKMFVVNTSDKDRHPPTTTLTNGYSTSANGHTSQLKGSPAAIEYERILKEKDLEHAAEISRMTDSLRQARAEAESHRIQLGPLKAENESLFESLDQSNSGLAEANSKMGHIMASMDEMTVRHRAEIEDQRRHHEVAVADLESIHKKTIEKLVQDADLEQEVLVARHKEELAAVLDRNDALQQQQNCRDLVKEIQQLKEEVQELRQADQSKKNVIVDLGKTNADLEQQLKDTKVELEKALQQESHLQQRNNKSDLETLTPTVPSSSENVILEESGDRRAGSSSTTGTSSNSSILVTGPPIKTVAAHSLDEHCDSRHEFSWTQFVFPMAKKNNAYMSQPSTLLLSGGFMLVGLGVYALWHRAGMPFD
ncbi:hypothetical protein EC957_005050 [Mortierella hygrophila]|uniref:FHA domain-containing protein n=1 Tax=Mortierella hygrophila TaxID=979708 RepID=A0A9P6FEG0_9FUNG|nr:hypothetical protein EC957_005050 [Mortierella hygrophila]